MGYSQHTDPEKTSRALGKEIRCSPKHCREVLKELRGMKVERAKEYLEGVIEKKTPVRYTRFKKWLNPKPKTGPARFPVKAAKEILRVIESARTNAEYKGLDAENMRIKVAAAHRGRIDKSYMPRAHGRSSPWHEQTTNIEIVLEEVEAS